MSELIIVEQLPVIRERLQIISEQIDVKIRNALTLECSADTVKQIKVTRAELTKDFNLLEDKRKDVKTAIMRPYEKFEAIYKTYVSNKFKAADCELKNRISSFESGMKKLKEDEIREFFDEYAASKNIDFLTFQMSQININLSTSTRNYKEQSKQFIDKVADDLKLISTQEYATEILVEYKQNLNVSQAITTVVNRHKLIEAQNKKAEESGKIEAQKQKNIAKIEALSAPKIQHDEAILCLNFKVWGTREKLVALKKFLNVGGYEYE